MLRTSLAAPPPRCSAGGARAGRRCRCRRARRGCRPGSPTGGPRSGSIDTGTLATSGPPGQLTAFHQVAPQGPGAHRQVHVVERGPVRTPDVLQFPEWQRRHGEGPVRGERDVERRPRDVWRGSGGLAERAAPGCARSRRAPANESGARRGGPGRACWSCGHRRSSSLGRDRLGPPGRPMAGWWPRRWRPRPRSAAGPPPPMPSATAWWILATTAIRPPSRPSTTISSHSGRSRRRGVPAKSATTAARVAVVTRRFAAGAAHVAARSKPGSSIQTGCPRRQGTVTMRRRNGGRRHSCWPRPRQACRRRSPSGMPETSETATLMVCMWAVGVSE